MRTSAHLGYCDIIYHKQIPDDLFKGYIAESSNYDPVNINLYFNNKIESVQHNSAT